MSNRYKPGNKEFDQLYQQLSFSKSDVIDNTQVAVLNLHPYIEELRNNIDTYTRDEYLDLIGNVASYKVYRSLIDELLRYKPALVTVCVCSHKPFQLDRENTKSTVLSKNSDLSEFEDIIVTVYYRLKHNEQSKYDKVVLLLNYFD